MAYLNANIPPEYAQIRREYLYDLKKHHGEVEDCIIFGLSAITGRSILFHCIMENGAIYYPSFTVKNNVPDWKVQTSEWNVENTSQWKTEDTDKFFYEIEEKKHD
jgi:hypothetical protein